MNTAIHMAPRRPVSRELETRRPRAALLRSRYGGVAVGIAAGIAVAPVVMPGAAEESGGAACRRRSMTGCAPVPRPVRAPFPFPGPCSLLLLLLLLLLWPVPLLWVIGGQTPVMRTASVAGATEAGAAIPDGAAIAPSGDGSEVAVEFGAGDWFHKLPSESGAGVSVGCGCGASPAGRGRGLGCAGATAVPKGGKGGSDDED
jgi:hypothetical protein